MVLFLVPFCPPTFNGYSQGAFFFLILQSGSILNIPRWCMHVHFLFLVNVCTFLNWWPNHILLGLTPPLHPLQPHHLNIIRTLFLFYSCHNEQKVIIYSLLYFFSNQEWFMGTIHVTIFYIHGLNFIIYTYNLNFLII